MSTTELTGTEFHYLDDAWVFLDLQNLAGPAAPDQIERFWKAVAGVRSAFGLTQPAG